MASPKSGKAGTAVPPVNPSAALTAADAKAGALTDAQSSPATTTAGTTTSVLVSGDKGEANSEKPIRCGGPYIMSDGESSGKRKAGEDFFLQLVPPRYGGDQVLVESDGKCSCKGAIYMVGEVASIVNQPIKVEGWMLTLEPFQLILQLPDVQPKALPVTISCGKDDTTIQSGMVEVYPSNKAAVKAEFDKLFEKCPWVESVFDRLAEFFAKITGQVVMIKDGVSLDLLAGTLTVPLPVLSVEINGQWKEMEAKDAEPWRVEYTWDALVTVGLTIDMKWDVIACAAAFTGVGAPVAAMAKKAMRWLGQENPFIFFDMNLTVRGGGSCAWEGKLTGSIIIKVEGSVALGASLGKASKGDKFAISCDIKATTALSGFVKGGGSSSGFEASFELLKWEGVQGQASITFTCSKFFSTGYEASAQLIKGAGPLWSGKFPHEIA